MGLPLPHSEIPSSLGTFILCDKIFGLVLCNAESRCSNGKYKRVLMGKKVGFHHQVGRVKHAEKLEQNLGKEINSKVSKMRVSRG